FQCLEEIRADREHRRPGFGLPELDEQFLDAVLQHLRIRRELAAVSDQGFVMPSEQQRESFFVAVAKGFPKRYVLAVITQEIVMVVICKSKEENTAILFSGKIFDENR